MARSLIGAKKARLAFAAQFTILLQDGNADNLLLMPSPNVEELVSGLQLLMHSLVVAHPGTAPTSRVIDGLYVMLGKDRGLYMSRTAQAMGFGILAFCEGALSMTPEQTKACLGKYGTEVKRIKKG